MPKFALKTVDRWGIPQAFSVEEEVGGTRPRKWIYRIYPQAGAEFFEATFIELENGMLQVDVVDCHGLAEFRGMGIPEALYRHVSVERSCTVRSSRNVPDGEPADPFHPEPEFLSPPAHKVWKRLEAAGDAYFDRTADRWFLRGPGSAI